MTRAEWDAAPSDFYPPWSLATVRERFDIAGAHLAAVAVCFVLGALAFELAASAIDASNARTSERITCASAAHSLARCR